MIITLTSGAGYGRTPLSAFDAALHDAGIYNYNLLILSSVIPTGAVVKKGIFETKENEHGHRLYVVRAEIRSRESGKWIGAALGWYQLEDGRGVFVEHEEIGETPDAVKGNLAAEVRKSLIDLCRARKYPIIESRLQMKIKTAKVTDSAACVLVVGVYKAEGWE
ncbi:MAG: pyruvoyl-dependent arginine decarboxylase [Patescibacteria group bacterium]